MWRFGAPYYYLPYYILRIVCPTPRSNNITSLGAEFGQFDALPKLYLLTGPGRLQNVSRMLEKPTVRIPITQEWQCVRSRVVAIMHRVEVAANTSFVFHTRVNRMDDKMLFSDVGWQTASLESLQKVVINDC